MYGTNDSFSTEARAIESNWEYLSFTLDRLFHPQVICSDPGGSCSRLEQIIRFLSRSQEHEERLMIETCYPMFAAHKRKHRALIRTLNGMKRALTCGNYDNAIVFGLLTEWGRRHTIHFDKPLGNFLRNRAPESGQMKGY